MAAKAKSVDWVSVEADYRAGVLVNTAIGKKYGISHTAVQKRAKAEGWTRDLSKRIEAAREAKVSRAIVSAKVSKRRAATEKEVVEANANLQGDVLLEERGDIKAAKRIVNGMFAELGILADPDVQEGLRLLGTKEALESGGTAAVKQMLKAVEAAVALPSRAITVQKLTTSLTALIEKERQAFGIDKANHEEGLAGFLKGLDAPRAAA